MRKRKVEWKDVNCDPQNTSFCCRFKNESEYLKNCICYRTKIPIYKWERECWACGKITPYVSYDFCCGINHSIGDLLLLDKKLIELYPFIKKTHGHQEVIANTCIHCGVLQGNFYISEELIDMASDEVLKIDNWV